MQSPKDSDLDSGRNSLREGVRFCWDVPPDRRPLAEGEIHVWCANLNAPPDQRKLLLELLAEDERARAGSYHFEIHRNRYAVARGLLRVILGHYLELSPAQLQFSYSERGKPRLAEASSCLHFNLAHSADVALYAITHEQELGVDVEAIRPMQEVEGIARRFFCEREAARLLALPKQQQDHGFFNCWTRKEAYLKATGDGITAALDQFEVTLQPDEPVEFASICSSPAEAALWALYDLRPAPGYVGALAIKRRGLRLKCWQCPAPLDF
jgi:4'-phosphopantetheinyl transferase